MVSKYATNELKAAGMHKEGDHQKRVAVTESDDHGLSI